MFKGEDKEDVRILELVLRLEAPVGERSISVTS